MHANYTRSEEEVLEAALHDGEHPSCPRCGGTMHRRRVAPSSQVSYVRDRVWLHCERCGRSAVVDRRRRAPAGTRTSGDAPSVRLHFPSPHVESPLPPRARDATGLHFDHPVEEVRADAPDEVAPALERVERAAAEGLWAAGFLAYEAWAGLDPAAPLREKGRLPLLWFGLFREPREIRPPVAPTSRDSRTAPRESPTPVHDVHDSTREHEPTSEHDSRAGHEPAWIPEWDAAEHARRVEAIREGIARGDVYQVNLTLRMRGSPEEDPEAIHARLLHAQGRAYGAHLAMGRHHLLSASPELFLHRRGDVLETRPMKGTAPRGRWPAEDRERARALETSGKDRAENAMIVDLLRNDVGRVCAYGSVEVVEPFRIERYRTVHQMTSTVRGRLRAGAGLTEIFRALFPCGSVTGAPKLAAGGFIRRLEVSPREAYCGAIGMVAPGGDALFSVAIRTLLLDRETGEAVYGTGGGVTWDSAPEGEHREALDKAAVLRRPPPPFRLLETLRFEDGRPRRLERHLGRVLASARYWDFDVRVDAVREGVREAVEALLQARSHGPSGGPPDDRSEGAGPHRLRVLVAPDGEVEVEVSPLEGPVGPDRLEGPVGPDRPEGGTALAVAFDSDPVDRNDPVLFHKHTWRDPYRRRRERRPDVWDVVLVNREGEVTETTRANLVARLDGRLVTPPLDCGLLPGVLREEVLEEGVVEEGVLRAGDLAEAAGLWAVSSLRGWIPIRLAEK